MITQFVRRALVAGAALVGTSVALAQSASESGSDTLSAVLACADVDREILRLECYDEAVAALRSRAEPARDAASAGRASSSTRPPDATIELEGGARRPSAARTANDGRDTSNDRVTGNDRETGNDRVAGNDRETSNDRVGRDARDDDDRGRDQDGERRVTVVDVRTSIPGRAVFVTSDGEEFVQTSGRIRLYLPEVPFAANIRSGAVGGMFLTPENTRRSIRVSERD